MISLMETLDRRNILLIDFAIFDLEDLVVVRGGGEDLVEVFAVGIGDEDLAELFAGNEGDDLFDAAGIELVEDVVEE